MQLRKLGVETIDERSQLCCYFRSETGQAGALFDR